MSDQMKDVVSVRCGGLKCDRPGCGYSTDEVIEPADYSKHIGRPCPQCGDSLLTAEDFMAVKTFIAAVELIAATEDKVPADAKTVWMPVKMNGSGSLDIETEER